MIYFLSGGLWAVFRLLPLFGAMAKKEKHIKLNSMRVLEARGVPYEIFTYPPARHSALEVAELAKAPPAQVYKTLVVQREGGKPLLVMIAADRELNLKRLAASTGEKKLRMATQRDAERLTGLQVGGISALALLNRGFDVFIDRTASELTELYVSGGQRGVNLRLAVADLIRVTGAHMVEAT
jgi:Cys-tRNA(Pro)/Cys-tRNA(Cys) deacylase